MKDILFQYTQVDPTTWVYLSSLLMIGLYFKFNRLWSVRNLDLLLLILLAPGLLLVQHGQQDRLASRSSAEAPVSGETTSEPPVDSPADETSDAEDVPVDGVQPADDEVVSDEVVSDEVVSDEVVSDEVVSDEVVSDEVVSDEVASLSTVEYLGYFWLFAVGGIWVVRLLIDPTMVRRPMLEPNLSPGGLTFIGCSLFIFLMANVITSVPTTEDLAGPEGAQQLLTRTAVDETDDALRRHGPGNALLHLFPTIPTMFITNEEVVGAEQSVVARRSAKAMAILAHFCIALAMVLIGHIHFGNTQMGVGAATLYLLLPYTAQMTGRVDHALPGALLAWAVLFYRRPIFSGVFIGLAAGTIYYPLFLLPLWASFYWQRGILRFLAGVAGSIALMALSLLLISESGEQYWLLVRKMFGLMLPVMENMEGIWGLGWDAWYRLPFLAAFVCASIGFAFWPPQKNLGTLLSCTAGLMVMVQFWHGYGGGVFMAWYLPLLLMTIFRPNLEDRVAAVVLGENWFSRRFARTSNGPTRRAA